MNTPILLCVLILGINLASAADTSKTGGVADSGSALANASFETYRAAVRRGFGHHSLIPREDWPPAIRSLSPVAVYSDRANLVIVLSRTPTQESGLYVSLPVSSFLPVSGEGWLFQAQPNGIFRFSRTITPTQPK